MSDQDQSPNVVLLHVVLVALPTVGVRKMTCDRDMG